MADIFIDIFVRLAILPALFLTPWLLVRVFLLQDNLPLRLALSSCTCLFFNQMVPISMHLLGIAITPLHLAFTHYSVFIPILIINLVVSKTVTIHGCCTPTGLPLRFAILALFILIILLFPYTHFTGIDTYKWQDLATAISVEQNIPWLVHPLSLFGFTARSYPASQPLLLATIQILGKTGIEWGFFILSAWTIITGFLCSYLLGKRLFCKAPNFSQNNITFDIYRTFFPFIFAFLYVLSPVFIRYSHWATGRGLFLAVYPLFLLLLLDLPRLRSWFALILLLPLLATTHKVGFVAPVCFLILTALSVFLPRRINRIAVAAMALPFMLAAFFVVPATYMSPPVGNILGIIRFSITRFGWMIPAGLLGLLAPPDLFKNRSMRRLFPVVLLAIPLAYEKQMYGALATLPFIVFLSVLGLEFIFISFLNKSADDSNIHKRLRVTFGLLLLLTLLPALATIIHRSLIATPDHVYKAAMFLEEHDSNGPFMIHAPGMARTQVQAYVSGCPRFNINSQTKTQLVFGQPPSLTGNPRRVIEAWISYMRGFFTVPEITTDYYGRNPKHYYFEIDNKGTHPPDTDMIYNKDGVRIYLQFP